MVNHHKILFSETSTYSQKQSELNALHVSCLLVEVAPYFMYLWDIRVYFSVGETLIKTRDSNTKWEALQYFQEILKRSLQNY